MVTRDSIFPLSSRLILLIKINIFAIKEVYILSTRLSPAEARSGMEPRIIEIIKKVSVVVGASIDRSDTLNS